MTRSPETTLRILLADDHTVVRQGLRRILEDHSNWRVVAEAADGHEAVRQAAEHTPDVAVIDVAMPLLNGVETTRQIRRISPQTAVLVLSMYVEEVYVRQILEAGATGYLLKDSADVDLLQAVSDTARGKSFLSPAAARLMQDDAEDGPRGTAIDRYEQLSRREREVFQLVAGGKSNKQIAKLLSISPSTVETHRAHIFEKLHLHSAAEIVLHAVRRGVIR
jgi:DNA-binding NarL/FixJ family response regulator